MNNRLILGDNLPVLKELYKNGFEGKIDLIYADLPFNTGRRNLPYNDSWKSVNDYLDFLRPRLFWMRELLSDKGSIYVHLDWHVGHYVKILLDKIFGDKNFVNEIVWYYKSGGAGEKSFAKKHDTIFFYSKTDKYDLKIKKEKSYMFPWSGKNPSQQYYSDEMGTYTLVNMKDVWEVPMLATSSKERIGYPTQKPKALLERIIKASSNPGDIVADFFAGSGTTGAVAEKLGRRWIMCDSNPTAIEIIRKRMKDCSFDCFQI